MTRMVFAALLMMASNLAFADVLIIDEVRQVARMNLPGNGESKGNVESSLGSPSQKHQPVGDPPITRWDYKDYSVYFEYNLVLFTVLHPGAVIERS